MKTVIIIAYECDSHHSHSSKSFFGAFSTETKAIRAIKKADKNVTEQEVNQLKSNRQTQGLSINYILDATTLNP